MNKPRVIQVQAGTLHKRTGRLGSADRADGDEIFRQSRAMVGATLRRHTFATTLTCMYE